MPIYEQVSAMVFPVFQVGGSVRDKVMGRVPKDYDFATPLLPDDIEGAVRAAGRHAYTVGKRFGTIGCKVDGHYVEITTFRSENYTAGSRKPTVEFVSDLREDLSRRDFTVNAMAWGENGLYDPFGGRLDILAQTLKCVGIPKSRFKEDPLRILRAVRLASQLGFGIDQLTYSKMKKMAPSLLTISKERWVMELDALLLTD